MTRLTSNRIKSTYEEYENDILILPVVRDEKKEEIIYMFDDAFEKSVVERVNFKDTLKKIKNNANVIVAVLNGEIVGYSAFYMNNFIENIVYITLIAVNEKYRGHHIGTLMMKYIKSASQLNGFCRIRLEVRKDNDNAISFYRYHSFEFERVASDTSVYMISDLRGGV